MASFYAELHVDGHVYGVTRCRFSTHQSTGARGRPNARVRQGPLELELAVDADEFLVLWGATAHAPKAGHVVFYDIGAKSARETISFTAGHLVHLHEAFAPNAAGEIAYCCALRITAEKFELLAGAPADAAAIRPAPGTHGTPPAPLPETLAPLVAPSKQQRYDARMSMMGAAETKLAQDPNRPAAAQNALDRLQRNNVAVERAKLSKHVYSSDAVPPVPEPEGWHMLNSDELAQVGVSPDMLLDPKSGFKAALYQSSFERPPKLVVSYAGTEDFFGKDGLANLQQGVGLESKQYNQAMDLAKAVVNNVRKGTVETTGHSLGGGLASAGSVVTGTKSYTFNSAGLHANTVRRAPYNVSRSEMESKANLIDAYYATTDPLNKFQDTHRLPGGVAPQALGIPRTMTPAPQWQPDPSGRSLLRPRQYVRSVVGDIMDGHGVVPQMVDHIEVEKSEDTTTLQNYLAP